jgi:Ca2+-binding RTX toxin-like protein
MLPNLIDPTITIPTQLGSNITQLGSSITQIGSSVIGTDGNDIFSVPGGNANLVGYKIQGIGGNDTLTGGGGRDKIFAGDGSSLLTGLNGNDQLFGGFGNDTLFGDSGKDILSGGFGDDQLFGGLDNDKIFAGLGNDVVDGGSGDDLIDGSAGSDVIFGGDGDDTITGGSNGDIALDSSNFFRDYIAGGAGSDVLTGFSSAGQGTIEIDELVGGGAIDTDPLSPTFAFITDFSPDGVKDTFVLGDSQSVFYASAGLDDYALIRDFEPGIDKLRLKAGVTYTTANEDFFSNGVLSTGLFATLPATGTTPATTDLIALFVGEVNISLTTDTIFV